MQSVKFQSLQSDGAFSLHKNGCKTLDTYFSLTVSYFSMTVQNIRLWKMHESLTFVSKKRKKKKNILDRDAGNQDTIRGSDQL